MQIAIFSNLCQLTDEVSGGDMATIDLVLLNYNGRRLLEECLPSVVHAARMSRHDCRVGVIDNASSDDSLQFLSGEYPEVRQFHRPNRGLCSYNDVLATLDSPIVVLLNNDIKLAPTSIDPLVEPLLPEGVAADRRCFMTAPLCWLFDGAAYEGMQTALRWRWGLIQAVSDYPGHERVMHASCLTASAGAVMAVDRQKFLELGGFDPLYLPGRVEDLDFAYRGYAAGYHARYVPGSLAYHKGEATFRQEFGALGSQALALRNTLLFQWKNFRHPWHVLRHLAALQVRLAGDLLRAPFAGPHRRWLFAKALFQAINRWRQCGRSVCPPRRSWRLERAFVRRFDWRRFAAAGDAHRGDIFDANRWLGQRPERDWFCQVLHRLTRPEDDLPGPPNQATGRPRKAILQSDFAPGASPRLAAAAATDNARPNQTISVICIALNEERNLPGLLKRLDWADEVVVVDGGSRDATLEVARSFGARVYQRPFDQFARQQNFALSLARGDWVLSLDADERPSPEMIAEIAACLSDQRCDAYRVRVRSSIFGRLMRFSGTQDDRQVRLVRRGRARWQGEVHETLEATGCVGQLHGWLDHDPLPSLAAFLGKMHRYTTLAAEARIDRGDPPRPTDAWLAPAREVFRRLIWKQGLWDGPQGWAFCLLSGLSEWVLADKHRRLWREAMSA